MFFRRPLSLAQRLIILVAALALPLLFVVALSYNDQLSDRRAAEAASATTAARDGAKIVEGFLRDLENTTFAAAGFLGTSLRQAYDQETFGGYLSSLAQQYPEIRALFITNAAGVVTASAGGQGVGTDLSSRSYVVALKGGAEKVWSGSITGLQSGDITVAFGRRIIGQSGEVRGFVIVAFYPDKIIQVLKPDYPADARLVLIDEKARVVYDSGRTQPATAEIDVSAAPGVKDALAGKTVPIDRVATPFEGEPQFGALVPIARTGWVMSITRPVAGLDAQLATRLFSDVIAVIAALTAAGLVATFIAARLARPLLELSNVASAIARGERPMIPSSQGGVEVETLSAAMRTMQGAVAKREDELRLLAAAGESLSASLDYSDSLRRASRAAVPAFADWCVVDVMEGGELARAAVATADPSLEGIARELHERFPPSQPTEDAQGPIAKAIMSGAPVLMSDITDEFLVGVARHPDELALYRRLAPRSFISLPLPIGDRIIGAVTFITAESGRRYTNDDFDLAKQLARRIALSIENARLFYEVQQSVRTRDDFLSAVAHELKTPLTVISASAQMAQRKQLREDGAAPPDPATTRILGAVSRMTAFIEELLELVRRQADPTVGVRPSRFDLVEMVHGVVAEAGQLAHGQEVRVEADGPVVGEWDRARLERAVANLVGNAIKYNRPDGTVRVRVGVEDGDTAVIAVSDEGIGIPEADLSRIFERFTRGANVAGKISGSGVGLAIVRQVVEQHRGSVDVESAEGRGSTFTIRLPLARVPSAVPAPARS